MAAGLVEVRNAVAVVFLSLIAFRVLRFLYTSLWEPLRLRRIMAKQGVRGPPFRFLTGNLIETNRYVQSLPEKLSMDNFATLGNSSAPHYALYEPKYGKSFMYQYSTETRLVVRDPEMAREVFINNHNFLKVFPLMEKIIKEGVGVGMLGLTGEKWANERKALTPFFHTEALKVMVESMLDGIKSILSDKWEKMIDEAGGELEFDVEHDIHSISTRIISLTAFSSDWAKGDQMYSYQMEFGKSLFKSLLNPLAWMIPYYRKIPTPANRHMDDCVTKMDKLLLEVINGRKDAVRTGKAKTYGNDLLGRMLNAADDGWDDKSTVFNQSSVFNNCKLFYFGGQDTVSNTTMFALMMLANHPEWQDRARKEILEVVKEGEDFTAASLPMLKTVGMIVYETLRLLPPGPGLARQAAKDLQLKKLLIPKGLIVEVGVVAMQHDRDLWGEDVGKFNPARFANGISGACTHPQAFSPFGLGPKICIGNNYAEMEVKLVLSSILRNYQVLPSPKYKHHPIFSMGLKPKYGLPLIVKKL